MRQLFSVLLLALIGFSSISPALVAAEGSELPACCRKAGAHHCAMRTNPAVSQPSTGATLSASGKCISFPTGAFSATQSVSGIPVLISSYSSNLYAHPIGQAQTEARYRASLTRGWQKRGPPVFSPNY
ncbi:MAG: hypothetical protein M3Z09_07295 [Acidobacteriota bacterium]|nr:hypothetical protein [Acidobacteriota bacterium]